MDESILNIISLLNTSNTWAYVQFETFSRVSLKSLELPLKAVHILYKNDYKATIHFVPQVFEQTCFDNFIHMPFDAYSSLSTIYSTMGVSVLVEWDKILHSRYLAS